MECFTCHPLSSFLFLSLLINAQKLYENIKKLSVIQLPHIISEQIKALSLVKAVTVNGFI